MITRIDGIDVSQVQGLINWHAAAEKGGVRFVIAKATEGASYKDPRFAKYIEGARAEGIVVGAYHFGRPNYPADLQAQHFFAVSGGLGAGDNELPPALDMEVDGKMSAESVVAWMRDFITAAKALWGFAPMLYTYPHYWAQLGKHAADATDLACCHLWMAHYFRTGAWYPSPNEAPHVPPPWRSWVFWQFSGNGGLKVPGVPGDCDRNVFNGDEAALRSFAAAYVPPPAA